MYSYKNAKLHDTIRRWNTAQLIENLESNGLGDCCQAIQDRQVDGETFLNLSEGQLTFWRNTLNNVQIKRLWSIVQLAQENPQNFVINQTNTNIDIPNRHKTEKIKSPIAESLENVLNFQTNQLPIEMAPSLSVLPPKPLQSNIKKALLPPVPIDEPLFPPESPHNFPKPPVQQILSEVEESVYEEEPIVNPIKSTVPLTVNQISIPKREISLPPNFGRPLPTPPKDEIPFSPPNIQIPKVSRALAPDLPRPPIPIPPVQIPIFHDAEDDDNVDYDSVNELNLDEYKMQSWYFKSATREEAKKLLQNQPSGTFIARPSKKPQYECSFSVICENKIYNLAVVKEGGKFVLGKNSFNTVMEIVKKFTESPLVLTNPKNQDIYVTLKKFMRN